MRSASPAVSAFPRTVPAPQAAPWRPSRLLPAFPRHRTDTRGTNQGGRSELAAGPVGFSLPLPNRRACRCHAEPHRRGRPYGHAPVRVPAAGRRKRQSRRCPERSRPPLCPVPATSFTAAAGTRYRAPAGRGCDLHPRRHGSLRWVSGAALPRSWPPACAGPWTLSLSGTTHPAWRPFLSLLLF